MREGFLKSAIVIQISQHNLTPLNGLCFERFFLASDRGRRTGVYVVAWTWFVEQFVRVVCQDELTLLYIAMDTGRIGGNENGTENP